MNKVMPYLGFILMLFAATCSLAARGQDARPFEDVKPEHWAYQAVADLQSSGVISGYPDGHFSGRRTLTRYEFAVAVKRAFDRPAERADSPSSPLTIGQKALPRAGGPAAPAGLTADGLDELRRLSVLFKDELISLGMNMDALRNTLDAFAKTVASANRRLNGPGYYQAGKLEGDGSRRPQFALPDYTQSIRGLSPTVPGNMAPAGFEIRSRLGSGSASLIGGSFFDANDAERHRRNSLVPAGAGSILQLAPSPSLTNERPYSQFSAFTPIGQAGLSPFTSSGVASGRLVGLRGDLPLLGTGSVGVSLLNYTSAGSSLTGGNFGYGSAYGDSGTVYGVHVRVNPSPRLSISGEASKSLALTGRNDADGHSDENSALLLNLAYTGGPITGSAGYQYFDPNFTAPGTWNRIGSWYNPTNVQGPFARAGVRFSDAVNANIGVDYLTGARNRPGAGLTTGSNLFRALGGVNYHFSKQFALSADYEGVFYDLSGAISASGLRARPVEQYLTLGAGLNLSGNTVLRLAYQIINVQDANGGFGLSSAANTPGATSSSVISTEFAIHF